MKRCLYLLTYLILVSAAAKAQVITNYTFAATTGTFTPVVSGTVPPLSGGDVDEGWFNGIPIGFEFWYMGNIYTQLNASTNGLLSLTAGTASNAAPNNALNTSSGIARPFIAPLWDNLDMDSFSNAQFSYITTGTAPNRIFIAEWLNAEWNWFANAATISFQARLYETTGVVEFIYRQESGSLFSASASIGISGTPTNSFLSLSNSGSSPAVSSSTSYNNINTKPATGQVYSFTPAIPGDPSSASTSNITPTGLQLSWSAATGAIKYAVYKSIDNVNYTFVNQTASLSMIIGALSPSTFYYFKVYAVSEGAYSVNSASTTATTNTGSLTGTFTIPGNFNTITQALDSIKRTGIGGPVILELQSNYTSAGERFPIYFSDTLGTSPAAPLTLMPAAGATGLVIQPPNYINAVIMFTGARNITIDGRPGGTGSNIELTVKSHTYGAGINFYLLPCFDNMIRYVRMNNYTTTNAYTYNLLQFSYVQGNIGHKYNTITNCEIGDSVTKGYYLAQIYGYSSAIPSDNVISYNKFINFGYYSNYALYITNANNMLIEGNHFYNLSANTGSGITNTYAIYLAGNGHRINRNFIGGSDTACLGNAFETGPANLSSTFYGIYYAGALNQRISIQGNKIANFFWPGTSLNPWTGIHIQGGSANIGDTLPNIIGDTTNAVSVYVLNQNGNSAVTAYGVRSVSGNNAALVVGNNFISGITVVGTNSSYPSSVAGIHLTNALQMTITNNKIGSTLYPNAIRAASPSPSYVQTLTGIYASPAVGGTLTIQGNTIANMVNANLSAGAGNITAGIWAVANNNTYIRNNTIQSLSTMSASVNSLGTAGLNGIYYNTVSGNAVISGNRIWGLQLSNTSAPVYCYGINVASTSGSTIEVNGNFIHSFKTLSTSPSSGFTGINLENGIINCYNNMIRLGIDENGNSNAASSVIMGINKLTNYSSNITHNSVYIGGLCSGTSLSNTYALRKSSDGSDIIKNNILCNARSNATSGGKHFALGLNSINNTQLNYNLYAAPGNNGKLIQNGGTDYNNLMNWFFFSSYDVLSDTGSAGFINPAGNAASVDLHITGATKIEANGESGGVAEDFDGQLRNNFSPVDIGADAGNFIRIPINPLPVSWNGISANVKEKDVKVIWSVASQINNEKFVIERSDDMENFNPVGEVAGAGNITTPMQYEFNDHGAFSGNQTQQLFYRIRQVDYDGNFSFSKVVAASYQQSNTSGISIQPNPANGIIHITGINTVLPVKVIVTDIAGRELLSVERTGSGTLPLDLSHLKKGLYLISVVSDQLMLLSSSKLILE